jgi:chromatin assembly factor 1 subunit A
LSSNFNLKCFIFPQKFFDYEVDSDDEWEEEEPGESLHGSDSEKEKDGADEEEYEVDNDFFVPHGHLSDEEMQDDEQEENNHPETQKAKLKILQQEFAAEMKKKTEKIKPRLIGCIWMNGDEDENGCTMDKKYHCSDIIWRILKAREAWTTEEGIKLEDNFEPELPEPEEEVEPKTPANQKNQPKAKFNDGSIKELLRLVHGNLNGRKFIIREFQAYRLKNYHKEPDFLEFSQRNVDEKMLEVADYKTCPDEGPLFGKKCWYVKNDVMQQFFGDDNLKLPNEWTYILEKEVKEKKPKQPVLKTAEVEKKKETSPPVVKEIAVVKETTKPIPEVFRASQASVKLSQAAVKASPIPIKTQPSTAKASPIAVKRQSSTAKASPIAVKAQPSGSAPVKKRVQLLMSVPCGQPIPEAKKNNLISLFKQSQGATATTSTSSTTLPTTKTAKPTPAAASTSKMEVDDDVICID